MDTQDLLTFNTALKTLSSLAKAGDNHGVIKRGLLLYLISHEDRNDVQDSMPLVYVQSAIERLMSAISGSESHQPIEHMACSFCGQSPPKVRLGAGPDVFICNACVEMFAGEFKTEPKST